MSQAPTAAAAAAVEPTVQPLGPAELAQADKEMMAGPMATRQTVATRTHPAAAAALAEREQTAAIQTREARAAQEVLAASLAPASLAPEAVEAGCIRTIVRPAGLVVVEAAVSDRMARQTQEAAP
jgi:hypothetical protein